MITKDELAERLKHACAEVIASEAELTEIDSHFGDADHGITMHKIASAIAGAVDDADGSIQEMLDDVAMAVMVLNGGSAVPLWNTWLDGLQEAAPDADAVGTSQLKAMFANALEELDDMSGAKVGDKTMMDAVIPASEAIAGYDDALDEAGLFACAAEAAEAGAENSKNFPSKFGRAKSYADNMASITVKSTDATHPQNGMSFGDLGETDQMEIGVGQHGEGGGVRVPMASSKETVGLIAPKLVEAIGLKSGDKAFVMINGCGATTMMEQLILYKDTVEYLEGLGVEVVANMVGEILTVQESGGFQMNIAKWDDSTLNSKRGRAFPRSSRSSRT